MNTGTGSSFGMIVRLQGGIFPLFREEFKLEFENTLNCIMHTPRPFHNNIHKAIFIVTCSLNIKAITTLAINIASRVHAWLLYFNCEFLQLRLNIEGSHVVYRTFSLGYALILLYLVSLDIFWPKMDCYGLTHLPDDFRHSLAWKSESVSCFSHTTFIA